MHLSGRPGKKQRHFQKTNFYFEIIIGEDDSTDNTRDICKGLAEKNQDKIRLFLRSEKDKIYHRGRKTSRFNYMSNLRSARGNYIALCDGDDYWTDSKKLQKQVTILDENKNFIASHHWQKNAVFEDDNWSEVDSPKENGSLFVFGRGREVNYFIFYFIYFFLINYILIRDN